MISLREVFTKLDEFTKPPKDGDFDQHIHKAMEAVYWIMAEEVKEANYKLNSTLSGLEFIENNPI